MDEFSSTLFSILLGWFKSIVLFIWSIFENQNHNFLLNFSNSWLYLAIIFCLGGFFIDNIIFLFRWRPYYIWKSNRSKKLQQKSRKSIEERNNTPYIPHNINNTVTTIPLPTNSIPNTINPSDHTTPPSYMPPEFSPVFDDQVEFDPAWENQRIEPSLMEGLKNQFGAPINEPKDLHYALQQDREIPWKDTENVVHPGLNATDFRKNIGIEHSPQRRRSRKSNY